MTWEEKIKEHGNPFGGRPFSDNGALAKAIKAALQGDIKALKEHLPAVKIQLEKLKSLIKLYFSYPGEKYLRYGSGVDAYGRGVSYGTDCYLKFENGSLSLEVPHKMLDVIAADGKKNERSNCDKMLLALSRFVRDAETRCLKHPRNKKA